MIQKAIDAIDRDYPELFWFSGTGQIETTLLGERAMEAVYRPTYAMDAAQRAAHLWNIGKVLTDTPND